MKLLPQELDNMRKNETSEREDHWNNHVSSLIENHKKVLSEVHELVKSMKQDADANDLMKV